MTIKCEAEVIENLEAGEFVNTATGELVKFGERSSMQVKFPNEKFHSLVKVKGKFALGPCVAVFAFGVAKDRPQLIFKGVEPATQQVRAA